MARGFSSRRLETPNEIIAKKNSDIAKNSSALIARSGHYNNVAGYYLYGSDKLRAEEDMRENIKAHNKQIIRISGWDFVNKVWFVAGDIRHMPSIPGIGEIVDVIVGEDDDLPDDQQSNAGASTSEAPNIDGVSWFKVFIDDHAGMVYEDEVRSESITPEQVAILFKKATESQLWTLNEDRSSEKLKVFERTQPDTENIDSWLEDAMTITVFGANKIIIAFALHIDEPFVYNIPRTNDKKARLIREYADKHMSVYHNNHRYTAYVRIDDETETPDWFVKPSWWNRMMMAADNYSATAVIGPTGNGKTTTVKIALRALGIEFIEVLANDQMLPADLIGGKLLQGDGLGGTEERWKDGVFQSAFRNGYAVIIDEADTLRPETMMAMQHVLQDGGPDGKWRYVLDENGQPVYPSGRCPIILIMNTYGGESDDTAYTGRQQADKASFDRLAKISTDYENEENILVSQGYANKIAADVVSMAKRIRQVFNDQMVRASVSPRAMLRMAQDMSNGLPLDVAVELHILDAIPPEQASDVRKEIFND